MINTLWPDNKSFPIRHALGVMWITTSRERIFTTDVIVTLGNLFFLLLIFDEWMCVQRGRGVKITNFWKPGFLLRWSSFFLTPVRNRLRSAVANRRRKEKIRRKGTFFQVCGEENNKKGSSSSHSFTEASISILLLEQHPSRWSSPLLSLVSPPWVPSPLPDSWDPPPSETQSSPLPLWTWSTRSLSSEEDLLEPAPLRSSPKRKESTLFLSSASLITPSHAEVPSLFVWLESSTSLRVLLTAR